MCRDFAMDMGSPACHPPPGRFFLMQHTVQQGVKACILSAECSIYVALLYHTSKQGSRTELALSKTCHMKRAYHNLLR